MTELSRTFAEPSDGTARNWSRLVGLYGLAAALVFSMLALVPSSVGPAGALNGRGALGGWFGYWSSADTVAAQVRRADGAVDDVMMFMWHFAGSSNPVCMTDPNSGSCVSGTTTERYRQARDAVQATGAHFYATHTDLSYSRRRQLSEYLGSAGNRQRMADLLASKAVAAGVDGVDLDWENFAFNDGSSSWSTTRPRFVDTIKRVGAALRAKGLRLSVTVPGGYAPWRNGEPVDSSGYWVFAWSLIAPHVDRLRFMTYDWSTSNPGPLGPHDWTEQVITSAKAQVDPAYHNRLWIGAPQYGRSWHVRQSNGRWSPGSKCPANWYPTSTSRRDHSLSSIRAIQAENGVSPTWDASDKEWSFRYTTTSPGAYTSGGNRMSRTCKIVRQVSYADERTVRGRLDLVAKHGIGGVAVWNLAGTESNFYRNGVGQKAKALEGAADTSTGPKPPTSTPKPVPAPAPVDGVTLSMQRKPMHGSKGVLHAQAQAGAEVVFGFRPRGGQVRWFPAQKVDSAGVAQRSVGHFRSGRFYVKTTGAKPARASVSVKVRPRVTASVFPRRPAPGSKAVFTGATRPALKGHTVKQQQFINGRWRNLATKKTSARGTFRVSTKLGSKQASYRFRFVTVGDADFAAGISPTIRFKTAKARAGTRGTSLVLAVPAIVASGSLAVARVRATDGNKSLSGAKVQFGRPTAKGVRWSRPMKTNRAGVAQWRFKTVASGSVQVRGVGYGATAQASLRLQRMINVLPTPKSVLAGGNITFHGQVSPAAAGLTVTRFLWQNGRWVRKNSARTDAAGKFSISTSLFDDPQQYRFRFVVGKSGTYRASDTVLKVRAR